ncbi:MAG: SDR family oxidoreductase [Propioniciclava sp.]
MSSTVLVTGASGFIAKHIVRELLDRGYRVRAGVRSPAGRAQVEALFPDAALTFVSLDLSADDGWAEAMIGVDVLIHTASPFPATDPADRTDLISPAVEGTLRALGAAHDAGVTRVILTSSCAAIYKPAEADLSQPRTRDDWTDPDGPATSAYEASKTLAERAAWDFVDAHPGLSMTVINPGAVFGPPMDEHYGTSLGYVEQVLSGREPFLPRLSMPVVDVRDVARMHVGAITTPETIGQRFPANAGAMALPAMARAVADAYPHQRIHARVAPAWLIHVMARFHPPMRMIAANLGVNGEVDGGDGPALMGFSYIRSKDALLASAEYLLARADAR